MTVINNWKPTYFASGNTNEQGTEVLRMNGKPKRYDGIIRHVVKEIGNADIEHALAAEDFTEAKAKRFGKQGNPLSTVMLTFSTEEDFNRAITNGVYIGRMHFTVHCYKPTKRPMQCFKCNKFGHPIKWCRNNQKCAFCSSTNHTEENCHHQEYQDRHYCSNCQGNHTSRSHICPVYIQAMTLITQDSHHD